MTPDQNQSNSSDVKQQIFYPLDYVSQQILGRAISEYLTANSLQGAPIGAILAYGSTTAPSGWFICDGSAISRTTYASLFAVVGTSFGTGDGSTTFNLPNTQGKVIAGYDSTQTEFDVLGETGGVKTHTLTIAEMPAHTHSTGYTDDRAAPSGGTTVPQNTANTTFTGSTGGGGAHNNLQPYIAIPYIIKY